MTPERRKQIARLAELVRQHFATPTGKVDPSAIAKRLGGSVEQSWDLPPGADALVRKTGERSFEIKLHLLDADTRQRFSVAHELGHLFIHMGYLFEPATWQQISTDFVDGAMYRQDRHSEEEYEANEFAGALLMPEAEFRQLIQQHNKGGKVSLNPIAEHYGVSTKAVSTRGWLLGILAWA